jgi:hypothetical protein
VFAPDDLKKKAHELPPNSVIVYDEGRAGLDSSRSMEAVNKGMQDFFQECGVYGHVILIVLPDFFQLASIYAVSRSLFLINVFTDEKFQRGYFSFYNERQKELLYFWGKKKVGAHLRYASAKRNFWGKFTDWLPFDKDEYENMKKNALEKKRMGRKEVTQLKERDLLIHFIIMWCGKTRSQLLEDLEAKGYNGDEIFFSEHKIQKALRNVARMWSGAEYVPDNYAETDAKAELDALIEKDLKKITQKTKKPVPDYSGYDKEKWNEKIFGELDKRNSSLNSEKHLKGELNIPEDDDSEPAPTIPLVRGEGILPQEMGIEEIDEDEVKEVPLLGETFKLPEENGEEIIESSYT